MKLQVTVFGASGHQGGSVCRVLLRHPDMFHVKAVTRNVNSEQGKHLANQGAEVVRADYDDIKSLCEALRGSQVCYVVTATDFTNCNCQQKETMQGKNVADACKNMGVEHVIFSTQLHVQNITGILVRHMVAKADIESYMKDIGLSVTCLIIPYYYENFLTAFQPIKECNNTYSIAIPMGTLSFDMISVEDIGEIVRQIILQRPQYLKKTLSLSGDKLTIREIAQVFTKHFWPKQFKDKQIRVEDIRNRGTPGCKDIGNMFDFWSRVDQRTSTALTQLLNPDTKSFHEWLSSNKQRFQLI